MKTYIILWFGWTLLMGAIIYVKPFLVSALNWICSHPTLWTTEFGYTPLVVIGGVLMVVVKKFRS